MKLCFISYARNNNLDGRLSKFIDRLNKQLPNHLPHGTKLDDLTFFDVHSIESGDEWMQHLSKATRTCKVCICFYSPPYFGSEYSGREVQVFLLRLKAWQKQQGNADKQARAIVPVIWVPTTPHDVLKSFQYKDDDLPAIYRNEGLLSLAMRKSRADPYNEVLNKLAMRIAKTLASVSLPDGPPIAHFGEIASVFHETSSPTRYGIALLVLADPAKQAQPFAAGVGSLESLTHQVASQCGAHLRELSLGADIVAQVHASIAAREMPLVIAHQSYVDSALNEPLMKKLASVLNDSATIAVFSDPIPNDAGASASLRASIDTHLAAIKVKVGPAGCLTATDAAALTSGLEKRLGKLRDEMIHADPGARAQDMTLAASAAHQGIDLNAQPVLAGPGG